MRLTIRMRFDESQLAVENRLMAQWPAQRLGDLSGCGQVGERLVEKGLCVYKRELLCLAQELVPGDGVKRGA